MRLLIAGIVLGVLAPTAAVLWFMNEAARSQEEAARRNVDEAYRGQLVLVRNNLDQLWRTRANALDSAFDFPAAIRAAGADGAILFDEAGEVAYPAQLKAPGPDPLAARTEWVVAQMLEARGDHKLEAAAAYRAIAETDKDPSNAARAAEAEVRCLVSARRNAEALRAIGKYFGPGRLQRASDLQGRWIAADAQLLAIRLRSGAGPEALRGWLDEYADWYPTAQRLFLIAQLRAFVPELYRMRLEGEDRLSLGCVEAGVKRGTASTLEPAGSPDVWKLTSPNGRVVALFTTATVRRTATHEFGPGQYGAFDATPGAPKDAEEVVAAGRTMPGWQLSFRLDDDVVARAEARVRKRRVWVAYPVVATMAILGLVVGGAFNRHMRLARLKTDLVAAVSHELKTPLASMRLLVDSLLEDGAADPQRTREYLQLIAGENVRLTRLIDNFLTFSRIERGRQRLDFAPVSPARLAGSAIAAMRERWPSCAVEVAVPEDLPPVRGDEDALVTVLLNLLENAWKYTGEKKRVALRAFGDGRGVAFAVEDNGIGIPAREQKKIFRRFYQVDRRLSRETGGVGLGLSIVESIVRAHGGTVEVKSAEGNGSTFRVWIPAETKG